MICCIAVLFLHFGATQAPPQNVAGPAVQATSLPDAPVAKPEVALPASPVVCVDSGANSQASSPASTSPPQSANPTRTLLADSAPPKRPWLILTVAQHGAAAFDAYSTRRAITHGAIEKDPVMRPFAHSQEIYVAIQVAPVMFDVVARQMQHSRNNLWRHTWWVPQSASTGLFLLSGIHDLHVAKKL